ncbi:MAG: D-aminoacyl-tRNA deacylase [Bacilli bacterium]
MRVLIQRVNNAKCEVNNKIIGEIKSGLLVFVGFSETDTLIEIKKMAKKIVNLRIFNDNDGKMNKSLQDIGGKILSISQFTLYANTLKGNRPSFIDAMEPKKANEMYDLFNKELEKYNILVETGLFGEEMNISLTNCGPVTISLEF